MPACDPEPWLLLHRLPIAALLLICLGCAPSETLLAPAQIDVCTLDRGESRLYHAELDAGDVLHLRIEQRGLDVEIRVADRPPIDLPYGDRVAEELWWQAERPGRLRVEVRSLGGSGDYRLSVEHLGPATEVDQRRAQAFWLAQEAITARPESTTELEAFDRAVALVDPLREPTLAGRLIHARGRARRKLGELDRAAADYHAAQTLLDRTRDVYGRILVINDLAVLADIRGDLETACAGYDRAALLFAELGETRGAATSRLNLGRCLMKVGALPGALPALLSALRSTHSLSDTAPLRSAILREIGWWYRLRGDADRAASWLEQARALTPDDPALLDRLATVHLDRGELDTARALYTEALRKTPGDRLGQAHTRTNLCRLEELASRGSREVATRDRHVVAGLDQCWRALASFDAIGAQATGAGALSRRVPRRFIWARCWSSGAIGSGQLKTSPARRWPGSNRNAPAAAEPRIGPLISPSGRTSIGC